MTTAMPGTDSKTDGAGGSLKRVAARLLDLVRTRIDLFGVELQIEKARLVESLVLGVVVGALVLLGLTAVSTAVVLHFEDDARIVALWVLGGVYLLAGGVLFLWLRHRLQNHQPFRHTLDELRKDRTCLENPDDRR